MFMNIFKPAAARNAARGTRSPNMPHDVNVFALSTCIHCKKAKAYLDECGVKYHCVHVDLLSGDERKEAIDEVKKYNPSVSFPTIIIDGDVIVGFNKDKIDEALKK